MNKQLAEKIQEYTKQNVVVAFSGGADSALLLKLACESARKNGTMVYAVTADTMLHSSGDVEIASRVAKENGAVHQVFEIDELMEAGIENNPTDRCYRCKKSIFQKICEFAKEKDISVVLEGTNADDLKQYRPGLRAIRELGIISPLADCELTKSEVRVLAEELGISVAKRAASPCLATRLPYGTKITYEILNKIDTGETFLRNMGFYNVRLRLHGEVARIEVDKEEIPRLIGIRTVITEYLKRVGFRYVTVDLEGFRSGSMDAD